MLRTSMGVREKAIELESALTRSAICSPLAPYDTRPSSANTPAFQ